MKRLALIYVFSSSAFSLETCRLMISMLDVSFTSANQIDSQVEGVSDNKSAALVEKSSHVT